MTVITYDSFEFEKRGDDRTTTGECNSNSNEGSPRISRFPVFYRDVRSDRDANRGRFFLGKNVNASVNGERPFLRIIE